MCFYLLWDLTCSSVLCPPQSNLEGAGLSVPRWFCGQSKCENSMRFCLHSWFRLVYSDGLKLGAIELPCPLLVLHYWFHFIRVEHFVFLLQSGRALGGGGETFPIDWVSLMMTRMLGWIWSDLADYLPYISPDSARMYMADLPPPPDPHLINLLLILLLKIALPRRLRFR